MPAGSVSGLGVGHEAALSCAWAAQNANAAIATVNIPTLCIAFSPTLRRKNKATQIQFPQRACEITRPLPQSPPPNERTMLRVALAKNSLQSSWPWLAFVCPRYPVEGNAIAGRDRRFSSCGGI